METVLADLAMDAYGVVTREEALAAGVSPEELKQRINRGTLLRVHRGVYRVGHTAPSRNAAYLAAVKAHGLGGLLCGSANAHLWRVVRGAPPPPEVVAFTERRVPGVTTHRATPGSRKAVVRLAIPCVSLPDTIVDLAACMTPPQLARACHEGGVLHRLTPRQVDEALRRRPNAKGAAALRRIIHGDEPVTLSRLESRFLDRLRDAGLPLPETNRPAGGRRVDCRWPERRLTVELDSYRFHSSRHAWEADRAREREARARGDEFRRFTRADVFEAPRLMLADLRLLLAQAGSARPRRPGPIEDQAL